MSPRRFTLIAAALLAAVILPGCSPAAKLVGTWQLDTSSAASQLSGGNQTFAALANLAQAFSMNVEFKGDGNVTVTGSVLGQPQTAHGTWRYVKSDGDTLVLMMNPNQGTEQEVRVRLVDSDHLEMAPPSWVSQTTARPVPFIRVKPK